MTRVVLTPILFLLVSLNNGWAQFSQQPDTIYQLKFNWNHKPIISAPQTFGSTEPEKYFSESLAPLKGLTKPLQTKFLDLNWSFFPLQGNLNVSYKATTPFNPDIQFGISSISQLYSGFGKFSENKYFSTLFKLNTTMHSEAFVSWQYQQIELLTSIRLKNLYAVSQPEFNPIEDQVQIRFTYRF